MVKKRRIIPKLKVRINTRQILIVVILLLTFIAGVSIGSLRTCPEAPLSAFQPRSCAEERVWQELTEACVNSLGECIRRYEAMLTPLDHGRVLP